MDYQVVLAPRAIADLRDIVVYISPERPEAAKRLGLALLERTKVLGQFPFSGRVVPEFGDPNLRELILDPYRIVYRVDEKAWRARAAPILGSSKYRPAFMNLHGAIMAGFLATGTRSKPA